MYFFLEYKYTKSSLCAFRGDTGKLKRFDHVIVFFRRFRVYSVVELYALRRGGLSLSVHGIGKVN